MTFSDQLLSIVRSFSAHSPLSQSTISSRIFNDGKRLQRFVDEGRGLTLRGAEAAIQWFSDNWPENAVWPEGVERPQPAPAEVAA